MINYSYVNMYMGGAGYIISMYFTVFLTDVVNLSLNQAVLVVMLATVWGAITDPHYGCHNRPHAFKKQVSTGAIRHVQFRFVKNFNLPRG